LWKTIRDTSIPRDRSTFPKERVWPDFLASKVAGSRMAGLLPIRNSCLSKAAVSRMIVLLGTSAN
jgi:hypothetical protein